MQLELVEGSGMPRQILSIQCWKQKQVSMISDDFMKKFITYSGQSGTPWEQCSIKHVYEAANAWRNSL